MQYKDMEQLTKWVKLPITGTTASGKPIIIDHIDIDGRMFLVVAGLENGLVRRTQMYPDGTSEETLE